MFMKTRRICKRSLRDAGFLLTGLFFGYLIPSTVRLIYPSYFEHLALETAPSSTAMVIGKDRCRRDLTGNSQVIPTYTDVNLAFVGVMTAKDFLTTRVVAANNTWMKTFTGKVLFFAPENANGITVPGIEIIALPGVDDVYPPQKKSFMMLKYMYEHYIDHFRFFIRLDDDAYIKVDELRVFLQSVRATGINVIGSTGFGVKEDIGKLSLGEYGNYCMGGAGMIITQEILRRTGPYIDDCFNNITTDHEDVELARCFRRFANVSCTWSYDHMFYHNYRDQKGSFAHSLKDKEIDRAAILHPVKVTPYAYRLHQHFQIQKLAKLRNRLRSLRRERDTMNRILNDADSLAEFSNPFEKSTAKLRVADDIRPWVYVYKNLYSHTHTNPRLKLPLDMKYAMGEVEDKITSTMPFENKTDYRSIKKTDIYFLYNREHPIYGMEFIVKVILKPEPKVKKPMKFRNEFVYVRMPYLETEFQEDPNLPTPKENLNEKDAPGTNSRSTSPTEAGILEEGVLGKPNARINFIMPLAERYETFLLSMQNFEEVCLKRQENVSLSVMLFRNGDNDRSDDMISYIQELQKKYPQYSLRAVVNRSTFLRGVALQLGSSLYSENDLLFFVDVDMHLHPNTLQYIRLNTVQGKSVYYPIVFSEYGSTVTCDNMKNGSKCVHRANPFVFDSESGNWRDFGFGITALYNSDFRHVGGFDLDIEGWGKEDIFLSDRFIDSTLTIFRSIDVGLVHFYHPVHCDSGLPPDQLKMCFGSKAMSYGSIRNYSGTVYNTPEILNRNNGQPAEVKVPGTTKVVPSGKPTAVKQNSNTEDTKISKT